MAPQTWVKPAAKKRVPRARRGPAGLTPERISDLVGSIYDCILNPGNWNAVLGSVCREFSFAGSMLGILGLRSGATILEASWGFDADMIASAAEFAADIVLLWGGYARIQQYPLDEPIVLSQAVGPAMFESRYYREWGSSQQLIDQVAVAIARDSSIVGNVSFGRHASAGEIGATEVDGLRLLAPHFSRAVTIGNLLDMKTIAAATFGSILDNFAFGIVLVDEHLGIAHANRAAQALLAARDPIRSERGVLFLAERTAYAAVQRAVRDAAGDEAHLGAKGIGLPVRSADGGSFVIHVLPIGRGEMRRGLGQRASVALFVAPAAASRRTPIDALALLYDLTPAEARVLELVAAGTKQATIGEILGIAPSTVKTHLLRVFDKTGCRRQVDLVRLTANLALPI